MDGENFIFISKKELEENSIDPGIMYCEDCRQSHIIQYSKSVDTDLDKGDRIIVGTYECGEKWHVWSLNGKRID